MPDDQLFNIDSEEVDDVLRQLESSFAIKFGPHELQHVKTFGELCDIVESKISLPDAQTCTSQQAFYQVRKALEAATDHPVITPDSQLSTLLPKNSRRKILRSVELQLGIKLDILGTSPTVITLIILAFLGALLAFFISASAGVIGLAVVTLASIVARKTGNTLRITTVRELVDKMTREQYIKSRRNPATVNRKEIIPLIQSIFMDGLSIPASSLHREATFN